jgi:hypothetical protein
MTGASVLPPCLAAFPPRSLQDTPDSVLRLLLLATPLLLAATARNLQATLDRGHTGSTAGRPSTPASAPPAQEAAARPRPGWL